MERLDQQELCLVFHVRFLREHPVLHQGKLIRENFALCERGELQTGRVNMCELRRAISRGEPSGGWLASKGGRVAHRSLMFATWLGDPRMHLVRGSRGCGLQFDAEIVTSCRLVVARLTHESTVPPLLAGSSSTCRDRKRPGRSETQGKRG